MGNQRKAMETLRFSTDPECVKLCQTYFAMSKDDQENLPLEIPCLGIGVSPQHILGQLILSARDASRAESALILINRNPDVLRATANFGERYAENVKDREMILKATGTLPSPAGSQVNVTVFQKDKEPEEDGDYGDDEDSSDLPSDVFEYGAKTIDGWGDQRRQLMDKDKKR